MSWQEIAEKAAGLPPEEKVKLMAWLGAALHDELPTFEESKSAASTGSKPLRSLRPAPTDEEKKEIRHEVRQNFSRDDVATEAPSPGALSIHHTHANQGWGASVVELLNSLDTSEWEQIEMPDVVAWLKEQRREQDRRRRLHWNIDK